MAVGQGNKHRITLMANIGIIVLFGLVFPQHVSSQVTDDNVCLWKWNCSQCIRAGPQCVWCKSKDNNFKYQSRCGTLDVMTKHCPPEDIVNPAARLIENIENRELSQPNNDHENIRIKPQEVTLKMRTKTSKNVTVKLKQAEHYPVDLYFIMDMSNTSANKIQCNLKDLLGSEMKNITKDLNIGFGSFSHLNKLRTGSARAYGFINHLPLEQDIDHFLTKLRDTPTFRNRDGPKGLLEAFVSNQIGWRDVSRKILLVATDHGYHVAEDGQKLGRPSEESQHVQSNGIDAESENMVYPSIRQINRKLTENDIDVIFAVTSDVASFYDKLGDLIVDSYIGRLSKYTDSITKLIREQYEKISATVELKHTASHNVQLKYFSHCNTKRMTETNKCSNIKAGEEVEFNVLIESLTCPTNGQNRIDVSPVGTSGTLVVNLETICECDCEKHQEFNSVNCSLVGTFQCGVCNCPSHKTGPNCEIDHCGADSGNCKHNPLAVKCEDSRECAHCWMSRNRGLNVTCPGCHIDFELVDKAEVESEGEYKCTFKDDDGCNVIYVYVDTTEGQDTPPPSRVQRTKECPKPLNALLVVGVVFGLIVLIGLVVLLVWKFRSATNDRREYAKFVRDIDQANWQEDVNPMFKSSTTTFTNPTYSADHDRKS